MSWVKKVSPLIWLLPTKTCALPSASVLIDSWLAIAAMAAACVAAPPAALVSSVLLSAKLAPFEIVKKPTWVPAAMVPRDTVLACAKPRKSLTMPEPILPSLVAEASSQTNFTEPGMMLPTSSY